MLHHDLKFLLARVLAPACGIAVLGLGAGAQNPPIGFTYQSVSAGQLTAASAMAFAPDGRLFVCERTSGRIRVLQDGMLRPQPWATVPTIVHLQSEQGLLGIAVDPGFLHNGFVYVYYTTPDRAENRIARLRDVGGSGTGLTVLTPPLAIPNGGAWNHSGGRMVFGRDGRLFVGTGDRAVPQVAQDTADWCGKVLRFAVPDLDIPADNPFPGSPVWSYGHRNQFGLAVHPFTGDLFQTENGASLADECNRIVRGGNYGWPQHEGGEATPDPSAVDPLLTFSPTVAPVGLCFYSGANYPTDHVGACFLSEFSLGRIRRVDLDPTGRQVLGWSWFDDLGQVVDLAMGPDGNLWVLHSDGIGGRGADRIGRYVHQDAPAPALQVTATSNRTIGGAVTFGCHGRDGDLFVAWIAARQFASPVTTPYGEQWIPIGIVLPLILVTGDDRAYLGQAVVNDPVLVDTPLWAQALRIDPVTWQIEATNRHGLVLR